MGEHCGFCIQTVLHENKVEPIILPESSEFEFNEALESVYPLLDIIFSYLNDNELRIAAKVKETWCERANRILQMRSKLCWITCFKTHKSNHIKHSRNLHFNNAHLGIFLLDYRRLKLNRYMCVHKNIHELVRMPFREYLLRELVNNDISYCVLSCPKVVSYFKEGNEEYCNTNGSIFDGVVFPVIPGIRNTIFHCNPVKLKKYPESILRNIRDNEEIACILLFALSDVHKSVENLFKLLFKDAKPDEVAVGGGIIRGSKSFQNEESHMKKLYSSNEILCVAFLKEKNSSPDFNAASFVIYGNDLSNEEFSDEILKFKNRVIFRANKVAFRICCGAKYEKDEEALIFGEHFPGVPLLGLEADGEIGWNCFNLPSDDENYPENKPKKTKKMYPKIQHEWSTIFVFMTWGRIIKKS